MSGSHDTPPAARLRPVSAGAGDLAPTGGGRVPTWLPWYCRPRAAAPALRARAAIACCPRRWAYRRGPSLPIDWVERCWRCYEACRRAV
eukprot:scaffold3269_cov108-Isochrysis_galbana.AAC.2